MKRIMAYKHYFADFVSRLTAPERRKLEAGLDLLASGDRIPYHYIKYLRDGVYELRVNYGNNELRLFFIYDGDTIVVLFNGFRKKTQKTPDNEIRKAIRLKEEYYGSKTEADR